MIKNLMRITSVLSLLWLSPSLYADWIPFRIVEGAIVVDIEIAGRPATAMLDSGATLNMIDNDFVEKYGQDFTRIRKIDYEGVNETSEVWLYGAIPVNLFGSELRMSNVAANSLHKADLLLGAGFFKQSIIQIDYPNLRLQLLGKKSVDMNKHANVPMKSARGSLSPAVEVELNGDKAWLILSTGSDAAIYLQRDFAMDKGLLNSETWVESKTVKGFNKDAMAERFSVDSIKIGPYELDNIAIDVPAAGEPTNLNPNSFEHKLGTHIKQTIKTKGVIGYQMLKNFVVTLDYDSYKVNLYAP